MVGIALEFEDKAEHYTPRNALSWRTDPIAATEIHGRLASYGFDASAISAEVYVQARELLVLFESLLNAAQAKRLVSLRELKNHRLLGTTKSAITTSPQTGCRNPTFTSGG